jgi:hypothetical protein
MFRRHDGKPLKKGLADSRYVSSDDGSIDYAAHPGIVVGHY